MQKKLRTISHFASSTSLYQTIKYIGKCPLDAEMSINTWFVSKNETQLSGSLLSMPFWSNPSFKETRAREALAPHNISIQDILRSVLSWLPQEHLCWGTQATMKFSVWFNICVRVNTSFHSETINSKSRSDVRWEHPHLFKPLRQPECQPHWSVIYYPLHVVGVSDTSSP